MYQAKEEHKKSPQKAQNGSNRVSNQTRDILFDFAQETLDCRSTLAYLFRFVNFSFTARKHAKYSNKKHSDVYGYLFTTRIKVLQCVVKLLMDRRSPYRPASRPVDYYRNDRNNKPQIDFSQFVSLAQVRGDVMKYAVYIAGRAKLIELYSGEPEEEWFLREIIDKIGTVTPYSGGVGFLYRINEKIKEVPQQWTTTILDNALEMLKFDKSVPLIIATVERVREEPAVIARVKDFLRLFETRSDHVYLNLFRKIVQMYRNEDDILCYLYGFQWEARSEFYKYFTILVQYIPFGKLRQSVSNIVNNPLSYSRDRYLMTMYAAILRYVEEERNRMMDYLIANVDYYLASPEAAVVLKEIINLATMKQKDELLVKFEGLLKPATILPRFQEEAFEHLLISLPSGSRLMFMDKNQAFLSSFQSKNLHVILKYMEQILKQ